MTGLSYEEHFVSHLKYHAQAFSFWKGRVALYAILKALKVGAGDEVIAPGFTCVVVANAIRFAGAKPVFVDIESQGYNLDPERVEGAITPRTRAVIIQHTFGIPARIKEVQAICDQHGLDLIEDCAHVFGSNMNGTPLGSIGKAAFYSSQWSKPYTTGLGGVATTSDDPLAAALSDIHATFRLPPSSARGKVVLQVKLYDWLFSPRLY